MPPLPMHVTAGKGPEWEDKKRRPATGLGGDTSQAPKTVMAMTKMQEVPYDKEHRPKDVPMAFGYKYRECYVSSHPDPQRA